MHFDHYELGYRLFGHHEDHAQEMHRGAQSLIAALHILRENQEHPQVKTMIEAEDFNDMLVIMEAIAFYQRIWLDAKVEEKEQAETA